MTNTISNKVSIVFYFVFGFLINVGLSQSDYSKIQSPAYRIVFYNVENLFDTKDDPLTADEEFLPESDRHWDNTKLYRKLNNIYKVLIGIGEWDPPAIVGLCEVENRFVLNQLVYNTPLEQFDYKIIHYDSPDRRGIDVALLYRNSRFKPDTSYPILISFPSNPDLKTRDILYVKGTIGESSTIHILVNHWPSRYGGYMVSELKRQYVARVLKQTTDSIIKTDNEARVIILGDFNDGPLEQSIGRDLNARIDTINLQDHFLYNLMSSTFQDSKYGTLKFRENWETFDQVIVSGSLLKKNNGLQVSAEGGRVYSPDHLLTEDEKYLGVKPFRTYIGMKYSGGYSDHLPVVIDLIVR